MLLTRNKYITVASLKPFSGFATSHIALYIHPDFVSLLISVFNNRLGYIVSSLIKSFLISRFTFHFSISYQYTSILNHQLPLTKNTKVNRLGRLKWVIKNSDQMGVMQRHDVETTFHLVGLMGPLN